MEIYLVRHTRPGVPEGTCYGRTDVPLDEADFETRLPAIANHLPRGMRFYSSPASRCSRVPSAWSIWLMSSSERFKEIRFCCMVKLRLVAARVRRWT